MTQEAKAEAKKRELVVITLRVEKEDAEKIKELARYAMLEGFIPDDHRGNTTAYINWCIYYGQKALEDYALKKRGF